jgi:SecD/SecF fusion protein
MGSELESKAGAKLTVVLALAVVMGLMVVGTWQLWTKGIRRGLDLKGGTELLYGIRAEEAPYSERATLTDRTIEVIRRRVDPNGTMELDIRSVGQYRFALRLPGLNMEQAKSIEELIQRTGKLNFCIVDNEYNNCVRAAQGSIVSSDTPFLAVRNPQTKKLTGRYRKADWRELRGMDLKAENFYGVGGGEAEVALVKSTPEITGKDLDSAEVRATTDQNGSRAIGFAFQGDAKRQFGAITERNRGKYLAIILDDILYSAPVIKSKISGAGIIESPSGFGQQEANDLIVTLRAGSLSADIDLQWKNSIGPELGDDSIRAGLTAALVGIALVALMMGVYYLGSGLVVIFAMVFNGLLLLATMWLFDVTMTLPGIAGFILTLGMAVDANVLILERLREEKARGKTIHLAVKTGYERAFVTIIDTHLTTIITAIILVILGTGPLKGFGLVLTIGLIWSIITSVFVTRAVTELLLKLEVMKQLRMLQLFKRTNIQFTKMRYVCITASVILSVVGLTTFVSRGDRKYDSDLLGGFMAEMVLAEPMNVGLFREKVAQAGYPGAEIQSLWSEAASRGADSRVFSIRVMRLDDEHAVAKIADDFRQQLESQGLFKEIATPKATPWVIKVTLTKPITETELRRQLEAAKYKMSDIASILGEGAKDSKFSIYPRVTGLDDAGIAKAVEALRKEVEPIVAVRTRQYTAGQITEKAGTERGIYTMQLTFDGPVPRQALQEAIKRLYPLAAEDKFFRVTGAGRDEGAEDVMLVSVETKDRTVLKSLAEAAVAKKPMSVPGIVQPKNNVLDIETKDQMSAAQLREKLGPAVEKRIMATIPHVATSAEYVVSMEHMLAEDKAMEKIRGDLERGFAGLLNQRKLGVKFTAAEAPDFVRNAADLKKEGYEFLDVTITDPENKDAERAVSWQTLADNLTKAGYADALLLEKPMREMAEKTTARATVKFKPTADVDQAKFEDTVKAQFTTPHPFRRIESVGGRVSGEMKDAAFWATLASMGAMLVYIWFRFGQVSFGVGALVATAHDVLITLGAVGIADALSDTTIGAWLGFSEIKVNLVMIGAILTLVGYSVNDTIVVFDRIRENMGGRRGKVDPKVIDDSVNQTLSRTVLTSSTVLIVVLVLYFLGGSVVHGFAFVLSFGVIVGTYSSVFIASPILLDWPRFVALLGMPFRALSRSNRTQPMRNR